MFNTYFSSDHHLGHTNIIKYAKRPFKNIHEMNEELIKRWNDRVKKNDHIYHLGDFALCHPNLARQFASRLNGIKYLIKGNHDKKPMLRAVAEHFEWIKDYHELVIDKQMIVLCHYAFQVWNKSHYGSWNLHGHSHGTLKSSQYQSKVDVGVDVWDYAPVSFEELEEHMKYKKFKAEDYHGR